MRRLNLILALLSAAVPSWASGNTPVTQCTAAAATSCTLAATPAIGNLMVSMAVRTASATAPTTAAGWTVIKSTTGNTNSIKLAWKYSVGTETTCGAWTNASQTFCEVYSGTWIADLGVGAAFGANTSGTTGSSTTISLPTLTLSNPLSTSWIGCGWSAGSATNADVAPAGLTLRSGTTIATLGYGDTNGNVATWAAHTLTITPTSTWSSACFELIGTPAVSSPVPNLVHSFNLNYTDEGCTTGCTWTYSIPSSLSGNYLDLNFTFGYTGTVPTISNIYCNSDTTHATWTWVQGAKELDAADTTDKYDYYIAGATSGCTLLTIVVGTNTWTNFEAHYREWSGVANAAPDVAVAQQSTGTAPYITAGAVAPTQTGDLIYQDCTSASMAGVTGGSASTNIFYSGGTQALDNQVIPSLAANAFIETGSESLTQYFYMVGFTGNAVCTAVALKVNAAQGTPASGVNVLSIWDQVLDTGTTTNVLNAATLIAGDALLVISYNLETANAVQFTGVSDTLGDSFTTYTPNDANGGYPNEALVGNTIAGINNITFTGTPTTGATYFIVEIQGLSHTPYDSTAGTPIVESPTGTGVSRTNMPTITPSTANGIVFGMSEMGTGEPVSVNAPTGAILGVPIYTGQTDASQEAAGNMFGYYLNSSTSAIHWGWTNGVDTAWNASAIHLEAPASGAPTCTNLIALLGVGCK
jgi:hypothetical protein